MKKEDLNKAVCPQGIHDCVTLTQSEARYRTLFEHVNEAIFMIDLDDQYIDVNNRACEMLGYSRDELLNMNIRDIVPIEDYESLRQRRELLKHGGGEAVYSRRYTTKDGRVLYAEVSASMVFDEDGKPLYIQSIARDVTERMRREKDLFEARAFMNAAINTTPAGLVIISAPDLTIHVFNDMTKEIFGIKDESKIIGKSLIDYKPNWTAYDIDGNQIGSEDFSIARAAIKGERAVNCLMKIKRADETERWILISATPILDSENRIIGAISIFPDITSRKQAEDKLEFLSNHDELTGLLNRRGFFETAQYTLSLSRRNGLSVSLIYADLDGLKTINDNLGHDYGDEALQSFGGILKDTFRESDIAARLGGDEFVALITGPDDTCTLEPLNRLQQAIESVNSNPERSFDLSISIGVYCCEESDPCNIDVLIAKADKRMYEKKRLNNKRIAIHRKIY